MGLGSSSLTMVELSRAYSTFATYGTVVEPYYIEAVKDRNGQIIESHTPVEAKRVLEPNVAAISHYLLREVATGGTAAKTNKLGIQVAGKTGTTNDYIDAWFVGYNPDLVTSTWVGFDTPTGMGYSFTGGDIALPIWMDYMKVAAPKGESRNFPPLPDVDWVQINEKTGLAATDGRRMPFLPDTAPTNIAGSTEQITVEELMIDNW